MLCKRARDFRAPYVPKKLRAMNQKLCRLKGTYIPEELFARRIEEARKQGVKDGRAWIEQKSLELERDMVGLLRQRNELNSKMAGAKRREKDEILEQMDKIRVNYDKILKEYVLIREIELKNRKKA